MDGERAAMGDWRFRDAHEFALGAALGFTFLLDAMVALGVFIISLGSLRSDSVTLFMFVFAGAFFAMMLVYSLFVAARWLPPAVQCRCVTLVPAALFRLLALAACLAYATSSTHSALEALGTVTGAVHGSAPAGESRRPSDVVQQAAVIFPLHAAQAGLHLFAALIVVHRLWLQSREDDRAWLVLRTQRMPPRASRAAIDGGRSMV